MDATSEQFTPEQELAYIRSIIEDSRQAMVENGLPYIIWGTAVAVGMLTGYLQALLGVNLYAGYVWIVVMVVAALGTTWSVRHERKETQPQSFSSKLQGSIWGACGSAMGILLLLVLIRFEGHNGDISQLYVCSFVSLIVGIAYFLSGIMLQLTWLRNIAFAWWIGAIVMYYMDNIHVLAVYAGMLIVFEVVPGIILNRNFKRTLPLISR
jgi:hypothetical protein